MFVRTCQLVSFGCAILAPWQWNAAWGAREEAAVRQPPEATSTQGDSHASQAGVNALVGGDQQVGRWIELLGSDQYAMRRRAEAELILLGADAFDQLKAAESHSDLEIATRARYILQQIAIQWVRSTDSPSVSKLMTQYGKLPEVDRLSRIEQLAAMDKDAGLGVLCRIARYDPSPLLSRYAALAVVGVETPRPTRTAAAAAIVANELNGSQRQPVQWLVTYADQLSDPAGTVDRWAALIDAEMRLLEQESPETDEGVVLALLQHQLGLHDQLQRIDEVIAVLENMFKLVEQAGGSLHDGLVIALDWVLEGERWPVLDRLESRYGETIKAERSLLYRVAVAYAQQGRGEEATDLADRAYRLEADDTQNRADLATKLLVLNHFDWAEREWRFVIESSLATSGEAISARMELSMWLHDRQRYLDAANVLQDLADAMQADPQLRKQVASDRQSRFYLKILNARREYYFACHAESQGDSAAQRAHLEKAYEYYEIDADVLIAMYRLQGADEEYRSKTVARIDHVRKILSQQIQNDPEDAGSCNHLAWLIANTEGDFERALALSRRSLQLQPGEASLLDTLARCHYTTGDLENALEQQRKAVAMEPHIRALRRQLKFFEQEMAASKVSGAESPEPAVDDR